MKNWMTQAAKVSQYADDEHDKDAELLRLRDEWQEAKAHVEALDNEFNAVGERRRLAMNDEARLAVLVQEALAK